MSAPTTPPLHEILSPLAQLLLQRGWMMSCAESCTGGLIAAACTDLAGSSRWFERGFVTYSNAAKTELLGVDAQLIATHGAVSPEVAAAMALGALRASCAQVAVAVTGIAGPSGGSLEKPVGTVCLGWAWWDGSDQGAQEGDRSDQGEATIALERVQLGGDRAAVRQAACRHALHGLLQRLQGPMA